MRRACVLGLAVALVMLATPAVAQRQGDAAHGRQLAGQWCRSCHLIGPDQRGPASDAVPTFHAVAQRPDATAAGIAVFLLTPHARMPEMPVGRAEAADLAAYIMSLRER